MSLPTKDEISLGGSLDDLSARKHFLGKTLDQAELLFFKAPLKYQEDLVSMGPVGFCFYVEALIRYIESPSADRNSDIVSCFAYLLESRLKRAEGPEAVAGIEIMLESICSNIIQQWERFEVNQSIYGNLPERYATLCESFVRLATHRFETG